ncbi:hypothetical protein ACLMAJ_31900 [Nocardia sp. KC 131]|uniref:hypothetical protein n=1 Tax=Nocardia arseniciresistens TaxID=3392119 RepID=UPI00398F4FE2
MPSQSIARIRSPVRIAFWGTSSTEHPAAVGARFIDQANLPGVGDAVVVEAIQCRGYVHRVEVALRIQFPTKVFQINHGSPERYVTPRGYRLFSDVAQASETVLETRSGKTKIVALPDTSTVRSLPVTRV